MNQTKRRLHDLLIARLVGDGAAPGPPLLTLLCRNRGDVSHQHHHARSVAHALTPAAECHQTRKKRWYGDRNNSDLALAWIRAGGRALTEHPARSCAYPALAGRHLTAIPPTRRDLFGVASARGLDVKPGTRDALVMIVLHRGS